ncbi:polyadenylate-binding protein-interacting protein 4-like [Andrographis paniculata]|uniref:polyadenylate-binding protein-interacting protein 4-like n=1 Tax=Andrographis paniculata TaxID=175694 RepID=UPI0021E76DFC|nr:polyadenylate-binding protein-interacting protein 4-like [Andrographis paniculata]XP_051114249.1 polyadenylate-binding protein-interacting protein 4-like [Andrographis paniculata]
MNMQQLVQPRSSSNGYGRRKVEKDAVVRSDSKFQADKTNSKRAVFGKGGAFEAPRDRLIYLTTCLIGHQVDVQVLDGSIYTGIFHSANADDFEIVLKMAHLNKDGSGGQNSIWDSPSKPSAHTFIIQAKDLVQVIAKGVPITRDVLTNELQHEKQLELMTDSSISQSRYVEVGRELERWVPDENDPSFPELENIFDGPWNRQWDQFEANATLFGVTSTFDEELYTTKLERGPQTRELEREAARIAREIEGEDTLDLHLAEERGIQLVGNLELDEETLYSSVYRGADDSGYDEVEDILLDSRNDETFGDVSDSIVAKPLMDANTGSAGDGIKSSSRSSSRGEVQSSLTAVSRDVTIGSEDHARQLLTEHFPKPPSVIGASRVQENQFAGHAKISRPKEDNKQQPVLDQNRSSKAEAFEPLSLATTKNQETVSTTNEPAEAAAPPKTQGAPSSVARPSSSASSTSDRGGAASTSAGRGLSSNSSVGSLSSEKSTLNPHAKEFKLNPNAKSFVPSQTTLRPSSPVPESSYYYPTNVTSPSQMHGLPIGIGMGPSFAGQPPMMFNPQGGQMPQPYYHPNTTQYGQQMVYGQPRPVLYMPYPTEMPYNGREF